MIIVEILNSGKDIRQKADVLHVIARPPRDPWAKA
jgi:hypothetical protein